MRKIGSVPWVWRSWARHELNPLPSELRSARDALVMKDHNLDGLLEDLDMVISTLTQVREKLNQLGKHAGIDQPSLHVTVSSEYGSSRGSDDNLRRHPP